MTDKELRKLRREDLLQILITQQQQIEQLTEELEARDRALEARRITVERAGSIAEAALMINEVFEHAQAAAEMYLEELRNRVESSPSEVPDAKS